MIKSYVLIMLMMIGFLWFGSQATANPVTNWLQSEKEKTIAYQQKSWESAKEQTANTKEQLINLFTKVKNSVTQD